MSKGIFSFFTSLLVSLLCLYWGSYLAYCQIYYILYIYIHLFTIVLRDNLILKLVNYKRLRKFLLSIVKIHLLSCGWIVMMLEMGSTMFTKALLVLYNICTVGNWISKGGGSQVPAWKPEVTKGWVAGSFQSHIRFSQVVFHGIVREDTASVTLIRPVILSNILWRRILL